MNESRTFDRLFFVLLIGIVFYGGMRYQEYATDSKELEQEKKLQEIETAQNRAADRIGAMVLQGVSEWKQNTRDIVKTYATEKTNTVFLNECITPTYRLQWNDRQQQAKAAIPD